MFIVTSDRNETLRYRMSRREQVRGIFITEFISSNWGDLLDATGYDFGIIDMEHGSFSPENLATMIPGFRTSRSSVLVRVPEVHRQFFQSTLDSGANGLILPMVESAEDVRRAVELMKYAPEGKRGIGFGRPHTRMRLDPGRGYTQNANDTTLLVIQIETKKGLDHVEEILSVPGVDVVFIGNADLSRSLNCENNFLQGPLSEAATRIFDVAKKNKLICGGNMTDRSVIRHFAGYELRFITFTTDVELMQNALCKKCEGVLDETSVIPLEQPLMGINSINMEETR